MPLGMEVGLGPGDGDSAPLSKKEAEPKLSAHVYCGQTAGCIKMPLGAEVGLGPGDIVLDGEPAPSPQRRTAPNFQLISVVAKRLNRLRCHLVSR